MPYVTIFGNTFEHREILKMYAGRWNPAGRHWEFDDLTPDKIQRLRSLIGCHVSVKETKPIVYDEPTETVEPVTKTAIYGDDQTYLNYFKDKDPSAFFGFSSLETFTEYVAALREPLAGSRRAGWEMGKKDDWYGTRDMAQALDLARHGWMDGFGIMDKFDTPHAKRKYRHRSLAGGNVNVGRMLAGNPMHMTRRKHRDGFTPITLFVETTMSAGISSVTMTIRAMLIAAIVDLLEREGYNCEIIAVCSTLKTHGFSTGHQAAVKIKEIGERLNLLDISFALGHPSFLRRMIFACVGDAPECKSTWSGMGEPVNSFNHNHKPSKNEFYIPTLMNTKNITDDPMSMLPLIEPEGLPITLREIE